MSEEQQESNELEADGVFLGGQIVVQCAECESVLELVVPAGADLADLVADCAACTQKEGARVVVPIRVLAGAEVVGLDNVLALHEVATGAAPADAEQPFATGAQVEPNGEEDGAGAP